MFSLGCPSLLGMPNIFTNDSTLHRSGKPHGSWRGDFANEPPTLDPGAQVVSGLQRYADGVSRRRDTRDSAAQAPHGEVLMDSVGVVGTEIGAKTSPKP